MTFKSIIEWVRFGRITSITRAVDGGVASEIEYRGRFGRTIGYFSYGAYDPSLPYPPKSER